MKALYWSLLLVALFAVAALGQDSTGVAIPGPETTPPWYAAFAVVLIPALNLIGKVLLMIPIVPNKLIPGLNAVIATVANYYGILGFDAVQPFGEVAGAGFWGWTASALLGMVQSGAASWIYENQRKNGTLVGRFLEAGKRSAF